MNFQKPIVILTLLLITFPSNAEIIKDWKTILYQDKCNGGGGFFLWDSKKCLLADEILYFNGKNIVLSEVSYSVTKKKVENIDSVGDKHFRVYAGQGLTLHLTLTLLPGCDSSSEQCTYRNYFAEFEVKQPGKEAVRYQGVGGAGS